MSKYLYSACVSVTYRIVTPHEYVFSLGHHGATNYSLAVQSVKFICRCNKYQQTIQGNSPI